MRLREVRSGGTTALRARLEALFGDRLLLFPARGGNFTYGLAADVREEQRAALQRDFLHHGWLPTLGEAFGDARGGFRLNHGHYTPERNEPPL